MSFGNENNFTGMVVGFLREKFFKLTDGFDTILGEFEKSGLLSGR